MPVSPILQNDGPVSFPSMPTLHGGDPNALGRIDHYDLLRKLGGGGFGVVYLAKDTNSGVEVALKTLHPLLKSNAEEMDALREKFALVSRLTHTNIAKALVLHRVHDLNIWNETARREMRLSPGDSVMVMDYAPGVTLSRWRKQFPDGIVPLDLALEIAHQLASALDYAHGERIVHRDIKPGNIMVETLRADEPRGASDHEVEKQDGIRNGGASRPGEPPLVTRHPSLVTSKIRVRILDFGLAAEIRSSMSRVSTEQGDTSGTRPYMAPEQWLGKKQDGRTDQYALACVLYELLSGAPPFAGVFETGDPIIMANAVRCESPEEIEDAPPDVNAALLRALSKTPKDRFASCAAFVEALLPETRNPDIPETQTIDVGRDAPTARPHGASRSGAPLDTTALEAEILRRKVLVSRNLSAISASDRVDGEFGAFVTDAEIEFEAAKEAMDRNRFAAAAQCLDRAEAAWNQLHLAKNQRKAREEAERKEREIAKRKAREEAERKAVEERARREAERKEAEQVRRIQAEAERRKTEAKRQELGELELFRRDAESKNRAEGTQDTHRRWFKILLGSAIFIVVLIWFEAPISITLFLGIFVAFFLWISTIPDETSSLRGHSSSTMSLAEQDDAIMQLARDMVPIPGRDYSLGKFEVTQTQWEAVMGSNPSTFKGPKRPVENVSWNDCQEFIRKFNDLPSGKRHGLTIRLPEEEEWEFACRAGSTTDYCRMEDGTEISASTLSRVAWFGKYWSDGTAEVGSLEPNAWGLYDMHGNVWEWTNTPDGDNRVRRGGSFVLEADHCTAGKRLASSPFISDGALGFRLAASGSME